MLSPVTAFSTRCLISRLAGGWVRSMRALVATCVVAVVWCSVGAQAAEVRMTIATLPNASAIRVFDGMALLSRLDPGTGRYSMVTVDESGAGTVLPVPTAERPFDADIGPDGQGRPTVVWSQCDTPAGRSAAICA